MFFTHRFEQLEQIATSLELDFFVTDELLAIDPEEHLLVGTEKVVFAVLVDDQAAVYFSILEVAETIHEITTEESLVTVDELPILLFDAKTATFLFVRVKDVEQADNLIDTLI